MLYETSEMDRPLSVTTYLPFVAKTHYMPGTFVTLYPIFVISTIYVLKFLCFITLHFFNLMCVLILNN